MQLKWHLSHAQGYLELGLIAKAADELRRIPAEERHTADVLRMQAAVLQEQGRWGSLRNVAGKLVRMQPDDAGGWITWAYATRRVRSLADADKILRKAEILHPREPTIQFNLGCYASLRGDLTQAFARIRRAIALAPSFRKLAQTDPDLEALRASGYRDDASPPPAGPDQDHQHS